MCKCKKSTYHKKEPPASFYDMKQSGIILLFTLAMLFLYIKVTFGLEALFTKEKESQGIENRGYYQKLDWEVIDYDVYRLGGMPEWLRGPKSKHLKKGEYIVCVGASQTFGRFCEKPYPQLLEEILNIEVLNLGIGGVGPSFFLRREELLEYINNSKLAVIQVLSGRSADNSLFRLTEGGFRVIRVSDGKELRPGTAYKELLEENIDLCKKAVAETRRNWVNDYKNLLEKIKVPVILFWFSVREPDYIERYTTGVYSLFGKFPHLVNQSMINEIKKYSEDYVECVSKKGLPQPLISRFTGKPVVVSGNKKNYYYPSPEMHMEAADLLEAVCRKYLD